VACASAILADALGYPKGNFAVLAHEAQQIACRRKLISDGSWVSARLHIGAPKLQWRLLVGNRAQRFDALFCSQFQRREIKAAPSQLRGPRPISLPSTIS
jgi:hypothetical protein